MDDKKEKGVFVDTIPLKGKVIIEVCDSEGKVKERIIVLNTITDAARNYVANVIGNGGGVGFSYIAIGTGTTAPATTDTSLEVEVHRVAGTVSVSNNTATIQASFSGYVGSEAIAEAGLFNDATAGTMFSRVTFPVLNIDWNAGDSLNITWQITVS